MLITKALLKSRQSINRLRPQLEYTDNGRGVFAQADPCTDDSSFNYLKRDFGLVVQGGWPALKKLLKDLNMAKEDYADCVKDCPNGGYEEHQVRYKLLFLARHGQGYHNLAIEIYGQEAWDDYWSKLNGDGNITWGPDPDLTPLGEEQAKRNNIAWKKQIEKGVPLPQSFYGSPFKRALDTYRYTWSDINTSKKPLRSNSDGSTDGAHGAATTNSVPLIVEDLRETIGVHTCDKRSTKTQIHARYPTYEFEKGFTEEDVLWTETHRETPSEQNVRTRRFLDRLFEADWDVSPDKRNNVVSISAHSGVINSFLEVIGHRPFHVTTGGMIPVLIKASRKEQF